jgi:hypothetical protein
MSHDQPRVTAKDLAPTYRATATLYNAYLTGLILMVSSRRGHTAAGDFVFRIYRQHHHDKFLSSLGKLGLSDLPHADLCARYHYLSNRVGGVRVEYMPESDRKAWVRFVHPRWIYQGSAICGVPLEVSRGMLQGWYAHNGVSLGNPRLGFVCTSEDVDGQYGLAGYFLEHDRDLGEGERLRFSPGEAPPAFDPGKAPSLDLSTWPDERLEKANRNYAMAPVRLALNLLVEQFGSIDARYLGHYAGTLIGLQYYEELARLCSIENDSAAAFADLFTQLADGQGDEAEWFERDGVCFVRQHSWRLMRGWGPTNDAVFNAWNGLWEGALVTHNRGLTLRVHRRLDQGAPFFEWSIQEREPAAPERY